MEASTSRTAQDPAVGADTGAAAAAAAPSPRVRRIAARAGPVAAAAAGGLLLTFAFPDPGIWPAAPAAVALITSAIWWPARGGSPRRGRLPSTGRLLCRAGLLGLLAGAVFFTVLLGWLHVIGLDAWLVLTFVEMLYFVPLAAGIAAVGRLRRAPIWAACLWVAEEAIRDRYPVGGFAWGRLAFSQSASPFTRYVALGGAPLLSFVVALAGTLLAVLVTGLPGWPGRSCRDSVPLRLVAAGAAILLGAIGPAISLPAADGAAVTAAVIQGNVPRLGLGFLGQRATVLHNHVDAVHDLAALVRAGRLPKPDFVILPENSSDLDPYLDADAHALVDSAVRDVGVPTLLGAIAFTADRRHLENRGIVWSPQTGPGAYYIKRHPVPFGEYVPMRALLTKFIGQFKLVPYDQVAGDRPGVLALGPATIGDVICFEVSYDGIVRDAVTRGGQTIVVQTNNADFGRTAEPMQQLAISRLRAVEHARPVLIAATSGISAFITPDGRVLAQSRQFTRAILVRRVRLSTARTLADRLGELPEWILAGAGTCAAIFGILALATNDRTRRRREL